MYNSTFEVETDKTLELPELKHNANNEDGYITELYILRDDFIKISDILRQNSKRVHRR